MVLSKPIHVAYEPPPVDERLVVPETRHEMYGGELVHVPPADAPHATRHSKTSALVEAHVGAEFDVASDMLTRTSQAHDLAPDVSVFPFARDPRTGGRQIEQLAFEVVSTETLGHAARKAAELIARGVRRVFAIDVERRRVLGWTGSPASWHALEVGGYIEDPALAAPLAIEPLILAAKADDAMARALLLKKNPVLMEAIARGREEGRQDGLAEGERKGLAEGERKGLTAGLLAVLAARGLSLEPVDRARILGENDARRVERWFARAMCCATVGDMLAEP
jgi:hypothetical protein